MRSRRTAAAGLVLGAAVVLAGAAAGSRAGRGAALLPCTTSQLTLSGPVEAEGAAIFSFVNRAGRPCTLTGYPAFSARQPSGRTALLEFVHGGLRGQAPSARDRNLARQPVVLTPGHGAEFSVVWRSGWPSQFCLQPPTVVVSATAPGTTEALTTRFATTGPFCGRVAVSYLALVILPG